MYKASLLCMNCLSLQKKKAISRRKDVSDELATYVYNMKVTVPAIIIGEYENLV